MSAPRIRLAPVLALLLLVALAAGCAPHATTTRVADVSKGDFYTNDEIRGLTPEQRDRYCESLNAQIESYRGETQKLLAQADSVSALAESLRVVNSSLSSQMRDLDTEVRQLRLARRAVSTYIVKAGDTLQSIASAVYGDPGRWQDIYAVNKDQIGGERTPLKPGTKLTIPSK
ncbi:MAG: LysM peptidoglycan-binding domain-containing protein [Candidatus Eisenbacteria bacterium]|nr:LysM peptidoglycan-binding domain-containing protein [Candidatus Eisenbacteria bacterium]